MWFLVKDNLKGRNLARLFLVIFLMTAQAVLDIIIPLLSVSLNNGLTADSETYKLQGQDYVNDLFFGHLTSTNLLGGSLINYTLIVGGILLAVFIAELLFGIFGAREATKLSVDIANEIRFNLFRKIQGLSFIDLDKFKTSSLITRLTVDIQSIQDSIMSAIRIGLRAIMLYIGGIISSVIVITASNSSNSWSIPVILVISSIALFGILSGILYYGSKYYKLSRYATDSTNSVMRENILGVRVVKSFNLQEQQIERFQKVNDKMRKITEKAYKIGMWMFPIVNFIINAVTVIVIWVGALTNALDLAQAGPIMGITGMILMGMVLFINVILQLSIAIGSARRVKEVYTSKPSITFKEDGVEIEN
ncbi:MAG: ABC transporter ATP-binding protein, partial [Ureaplasma sp.]|nr:ABC transporter ATP-binding protein [Ureaplasma sp.]